ncbi:MAG TPA: Uma2 family endonuclease [Blastocatellia bacterium]|nr:Uma2 family endonuclease [Blastocatellia bacterium]
MSTRAEAHIEDLYAVPENAKAEIINGELVLMSPTGDAPNTAATEILVSLHGHAKRTKSGRAYSDNAGFKVDLPNRKSFSLDVAFHTGKRTKMEFLEGAPVFAVEVRSAADYGPKAELAIARKRADYFAAGTLVVWDVDLLNPDVIKSYDAEDPDRPTVYRRGDIAKAESAVPGWEFAVDGLFQ